jgi:soluble lytic murein transglycosylase-like protein
MRATGTRLSAFLVPSAKVTIRFDDAAPALAAGRPTSGSRARLLAGALASAGVVVSALAVPPALSAARTVDPAPPAATAPAPPAPPPPSLAPPSTATTTVYQRAAATCPGLPAALLAAIHEVETGRGDGGERSSAGAVGPMQFLPETWATYGVDANGDGTADLDDVEDAVFGAAQLLCANGGAEPQRLRWAVWNYNHSWTYVREVLSVADLG